MSLDDSWLQGSLRYSAQNVHASALSLLCKAAPLCSAPLRSFPSRDARGLGSRSQPPLVRCTPLATLPPLLSSPRLLSIASLCLCSRSAFSLLGQVSGTSTRSCTVSLILALIRESLVSRSDFSSCVVFLFSQR